MARQPPGHRMPAIAAVHVDGTVCKHATGPNGKPRDPDSGCTGRHHYVASCECGWEKTDGVRESLKYSRGTHLDQAEREAASATADRPPDPAPSTDTAPEPPAAEATRTDASQCTVTVNLGRANVEISYRPSYTVWALLGEAVRAHGKRFSQNPGLRLHNHGQQLVNTLTAEAAGIKPGDLLNLAAPGTLPKAEA